MNDLEVPRRIDKTISRVSKSRSHAQRASKSRRRRRCLVQLQKFYDELEALQMRTIDGTLPSLEELEAALKTVERKMRVFTAKKPKRRRLRKLTRSIKRCRQELRAL